MMSFIYDEMVVIFIGGFIAVSAKKLKIYPIPLGTEIMGLLIGMGIVWVAKKYFNMFSYTSISEIFELVLLGYLPMRIIRCRRKGK